MNFRMARPILIHRAIQKFKTVDDLIDYFISIESNHNTKAAISYVLSSFDDRLLKILKRKDIKPSKYDLLIIKTINEGPIVKRFRYILNEYNNRRG